MRVELQLSQLSLEKMVSLPTFIRTEIVSGGSPLTGHLFFWNIWGAWAAMAQRCHPRQCTLRIYLWEGFWNGFLLGQACEVPATARGNHFRPFVCLDSLYRYLHLLHKHWSTCTGTKDGRNSFSLSWNLFVCHYSSSSWWKFLPTNLPLTPPIAPSLSEMLSWTILDPRLFGKK